MSKQVVSIKQHTLAAVLEYCLVQAADSNIDILSFADNNEQALTVQEQVAEFSSILQQVRKLQGGEYKLVLID